MSRHSTAIDADTLPKVWKDGRCYAVVTERGFYTHNGKYFTFAGAGTICLFSMNPEDWVDL